MNLYQGTVIRGYVLFSKAKMMDTYALCNLAREVNRAYFRNRTAAIMLDLGRDGVFVGSATCVAIEDRLLLATAAHNFKGADDSSKFTAFSANRSSKSPLTVIRYSYERGLRDGEHDIAWLEIDPLSARNSDLSSVALDSVDARPALENPINYVATGFPSEMKRSAGAEAGQADFVVPLLLYVTHAMTPDSTGANDILFNYGQTGIDESGREAETTKPHGMSGGGMWYSPPVREDTLVWSPERMKLIGITRDYVSKRDELRGVPIRYWLQLLCDDIPELRGTIAPLLQDDQET